jgi:hypothetical protein
MKRNGGLNCTGMGARIGAEYTLNLIIAIAAQSRRIMDAPAL